MSTVLTLEQRCFLCNVKEIDGNCLLDSKEFSLILCKVLNVPHLMNNLEKHENINYCHPCKKRILKIDESLNILKTLEKEILEEQYSIELQLETNYKVVANDLQYTPWDFGVKLVDEMKFKSIKSKLTNVMKNQIDWKLCSNAKNYRIMKNIIITEKLKHGTLEDHISKLNIPKGLTIPLIHNTISTEKQSFINDNLSIRLNEHFVDSATNSSFIQAELPLISHVYDFEGVKLELSSGETHNSTDVKDPFEGIFPESSFVTENSTTHCQKTFICGICETNFDDYSQLDEHCRTHIDSKSFRFGPNESKVSLNTNSNIHVRNLKCKYCVKVFSYESELKRHERHHTKVKPFKCTHCEKSYSQRDLLITHERIHTGEKPFKCGYCEKTFRNRTYRKKHEVVHAKEKPFKCKYCDKTFRHHNNREMHEYIHKDEKPFRCKFCKKSFSRKELVKRHERIHTGEMPYKCKYCEKTFRDINNMKRHEDIHKVEKPFKCKVCERSFRRKEYVRIHELTHTRDKSLEQEHRSDECNCIMCL